MDRAGPERAVKPRPLSESSWKPSALPWWKLRRGEAMSIGQGVDGSPDLRLWLLAFGRVGPWGHACFHRGELASLLVKVNCTTGEVSDYSERAVRGLIADLARAGLLAPASNLRCLVIPIEIADSQKASGRVSCPEHRCRHVWSNQLGGWVAVKPDGTLDLEELAEHLREQEAA